MASAPHTYNTPRTIRSQQVPASSGRASRSPSVGSRSTGGGSSSSSGPRIPHTFSLHTYTRPTVCQLCKKLLCGFFKQGVQCRDCHYNAHKKCVDEVPKNCNMAEPTSAASLSATFATDNSAVTGSGTSPCADRFYSEEFDDSDDTDEGCSSMGGASGNHRTTNGGGADDYAHQHASVPVVSTSTYYDLDCGAVGGDSADLSPPSGGRPAVAGVPSANIPLMRIVQSVKHTKRRTPGQQLQVIKEGWLVHFTNKDKLVRRHYWRVDTASITLFVSESSSKYFREILLGDILAVDTARNLSGSESHCFQIRTANIDFYVGQDPLLTYRAGESLILPPPDSGIGAHLAKSWETAVRQALMPVTSSNGE